MEMYEHVDMCVNKLCMCVLYVYMCMLHACLSVRVLHTMRGVYLIYVSVQMVLGLPSPREHTRNELGSVPTHSLHANT
jgi:hypothetical protein